MIAPRTDCGECGHELAPDKAKFHTLVDCTQNLRNDIVMLRRALQGWTSVYVMRPLDSGQDIDDIVRERYLRAEEVLFATNGLPEGDGPFDFHAASDAHQTHTNPKRTLPVFMRH